MSTKESETGGKPIALRVQEAKKRDIGRDIARIDQETMEELDIITGDVISLVGKKKSAGIAWTSYPQDSGLGIIRIDSRLKKNTGTSIDETIQIRKVNAQPAQNIVLAPSSVKGTLVTEGVRGEGGILRNNEGQRFMFNYIPEMFRGEYATSACPSSQAR